MNSRIASHLVLLLLLFFTFLAPLASADPRINEFVANNTSGGLTDQDGETSDWIELHNPDPLAISLDGFYLTDDATDLTKWRIPAVSIAGGGYLVIFASGKNQVVVGEELHTSFQLAASGEYLAFVEPDGTTIISEFAPAYPRQESDYSYGTFGAPSSLGFMPVPTPDAANNPTGALDGFVKDTTFQPKRGFYDTAQSISITTLTPGVSIYYTTDGSQPTESNGTLYQGPVSVTTTTVLRAVACRSGWKPTNVDTHSYIFANHVIAQPNNPVGFPSSWNGISADYEMDSQITSNAIWAPQMRESLLSIPSMSLSLLTSDLFGSNGIYANPQSHGIAWERVCSAEWIEPDSSAKFQVDCGLRIQGGYFRQAGVTQKHSFRLLFKDIYGPGKLRTQLFDEPTAAESFDTLVLRAGANDGYAWGGAGSTVQFTRDQFGRSLHIDMGHASSHGRFVHLYLNGLYWGLYNIVERPNEDHGSEYYGGEAATWDSNNAGEFKNGNGTDWSAFNTLTASASSTADYFEVKGLDRYGDRDAALPVYLDSEQYIDYMITNIWGGNWDWPNKNFWFGRDQTAASDGFKFYMWDFENTMGNSRGRSPVTMVSPRSNVAGSWVGGPHDDLKDVAEYQREFSDRAQRYFFNDGLLTTTALIERYQVLADRIESAVLAETARWGDDNREPAYSMNEWLTERDWILNTYLPQRSAIVLQQFKNSGLYPVVEAPVYSQLGGNVTTDYALEMTDPNAFSGSIYYTSDGTDPRLPSLPPAGGGPAEFMLVDEADAKRVRVPASQLDSGSFVDNGGIQPAWAEESFDDTTWTPGTGGVGYENNSGYQSWFDIDVGPQMSGARTSCLIRIPFTATALQLAEIDQLLLSIRYDDAYVAYVNGVEIARTSNSPGGAMDGDSGATGTHDDGPAVTLVDAPLYTLNADTKAPLVEGANVLALHGLNFRTSSSDFLMSPTLLGTEMVDVGTPQISPGAVEYTGPLTLAESQPVLARFLSDSGTWSALTEGTFIVGTVPANASNMVVSEFHYHPAEPVAAAEIDISTDRDDYEFVEFLNISASPLDLSGVRFSDGIEFAFPAAMELPIGGRLVLVANRRAFEERYADKLPGILIGGDYSGRLSNGGEQISLLAADDSVIKQYVFGDASPWPSVADGGGASLVLLDPMSNPNHGDAANWGVSADLHGCPGGVTTVAGGFAGNPNADGDLDGLSALLEYALGTEDGIPTPQSDVFSIRVQSYSPGGIANDYAAFSYQRSKGATDVVFTVEISEDLTIWSGLPGDVVAEGVVDNGDGTETVTYRAAMSLDASKRMYFRLRVEI